MTRYWRVLAAILLGIALLVLLEARGDDVTAYKIQAPIEVKLVRDVKYLPRQVEAVYYQACLQVATELRPQWSLERRATWLHPRMVLTLGVPRDQESFVNLDFWEGTTEAKLEKWDPDKFAQAVVNAALAAAIDVPGKRRLARDAMLNAVTRYRSEEPGRGTKTEMKSLFS